MTPKHVSRERAEQKNKRSVPKSQMYGAELKKRVEQYAAQSGNRAMSGLNLPLMAAQACCLLYGLHSAVFS